MAILNQRIKCRIGGKVGKSDLRAGFTTFLLGEHVLEHLLVQRPARYDLLRITGHRRSPLGTFHALPETRRMLEEGMREILDVGRARKIALAERTVSSSLAFMDTQEPDGTTSMQRDILSGRPSELDAWNGAVVRMGREAGVPTPLHDFLCGSLLPLEMRTRGSLRSPEVGSPR